MGKIQKRTRILVDKEKIPLIMKKIGCGQAAVYNALAFRTNSKLAGDIRSLATNIYGGVQVSERVLVR